MVGTKRAEPRDRLQVTPFCKLDFLKFDRSHKTALGEVYTTLKRTRLSPTITTSTFGAQRLFSSLSTTFQRSAARTATNNQSLLSCTVFLITTRTYAKKKMPPKKAAKEEKILLGRPGNNLKSGIVCCSAVDLCKMLKISGRSGQRWEVHTLSSYHQMSPWKSCRKKKCLPLTVYY
jgi:hypothetical protein